MKTSFKLCAVLAVALIGACRADAEDDDVNDQDDFTCSCTCGPIVSTFQAGKYDPNTIQYMVALKFRGRPGGEQVWLLGGKTASLRVAGFCGVS